jgi:hypothetical protein
MFLKNLNAQQVFHFRRSGSPKNAIPPQKVISYARSHRRGGRGEQARFPPHLTCAFYFKLYYSDIMRGLLLLCPSVAMNAVTPAANQ